jgi:SAM-dependent methyltransferase
MEHLEEALRLEVKTDPQVVRRQARWCGLMPGHHVLDAGCGPGKVTSILREMVLPDGHVLGVDNSEARIGHARSRYGGLAGIDFLCRDLRERLEGVGPFDIIWIRFFLEYFREESRDIVRHLAECLRPGGTLCLLDLDHNSLNHYELSGHMEQTLFQLMRILEREYNFDPYAGRKLYAHLYDLGFEDIQVDVTPHHLIYGEIKDEDFFNWLKKVEVASQKTSVIFEAYPGGHDAFFKDFLAFFSHPRRFTYTPLILCKGIKPLSD